MPQRRCALAFAALLAVVLTGCATTVPTAPDSPTAAAVVHAAEPTPSVTPSAPPSVPPGPPPFPMNAHSTIDPTSIWVVVNKKHPLNPVDYAPADLVNPDIHNVNGQPVRAEAAAALSTMLATARQSAGLRFQLQSGYRSYSTQVAVYNQNVAAYGRASADTDTARPGFSEHQTGLVVDLSALPANCSLNACFAGTAQGQWLAANAWQYGFLLRYPSDREPITGYTFEPWHYRYIGTELADEMHRRGVTTLEEFFGIAGGGYSN